MTRGINLFTMRITLLLILSLANLAHARQPNVVFILTDDQGYNDLGCYGSKTIKTPRIDQMAAEGIRLTSFYSVGPVCTPTRAAFMTGCYAQRVGLAEVEKAGAAKSGRVLYQDSPFGLNLDEITIAEMFKSAGYATGMVGKWHLGDAQEFLPTRQGFDSYFGIPYSNDMPPVYFIRNEEIVEREPDQTTITDRYTEEAIKFIGENKDKPFFLYLAHNMPHTPIHAAPRFKGKSAGGLYGDVVEQIDESVGKVLDALAEAKLDQDTIVVFTCDNGPWYLRGEHGGNAFPLRAGKGATYEGGVRVPCIVRWPGKIAPKSESGEIVAMFDFYPTFANAIGAKLPTDRTIDGKDVSEILFGKTPSTPVHDSFLYYDTSKLSAVRSGKWKLKLETTLIEETGGYGKIENPQAKIPERLYNLDIDLGEQKSVLEDHPDIADRLRKIADEARKDLGDSRTGVKGANGRPVGRAKSTAALTATSQAVEKR